MPESEQNGSRPAGQEAAAPASDEISLFDLWNVFARRRRVFVLVVAVFVALSAAYAFLKPPAYTLTGRVDVGGRSANGDFQPLEKPSTVAQRLEDEFVPTSTARVIGGGDEEQLRRSRVMDKISANTPAGTTVVNLTAEVAEERIALYEKIMSSAVSDLVDTHARYAELIRIAADERLEGLRNEIATLKGEREKNAAQIDRIETLTKRIEAEIDEIETSIDDIQETRLSVMQSTPSADASLAAMFASTDLREARNLLNQKRERVYFQLPNRMDELKQDISRIERDIELKRLELEEAKSEAGLVRNTRVLEEPGAYMEPAEGTSPVVIVALGGILGTMAAVFAVLFAEFAAAARARRQA